MSDRTSSSATVDAPRDAVRAVIADFPAYPQWAAAITAAEITETHADGDPARVRMTLDAGMIKDTYTLAYTWSDTDGVTAVAWDLAEAGGVLTQMSGSYTLAETAPGVTEVTYALELAVRVPMPGMLKRRGERQIVDTALKGLRTRVQSQR